MAEQNHNGRRKGGKDHGFTVFLVFTKNLKYNNKELQPKGQGNRTPKLSWHLVFHCVGRPCSCNFIEPGPLAEIQEMIALALSRNRFRRARVLWIYVLWPYGWKNIVTF